MPKGALQTNNDNNQLVFRYLFKLDGHSVGEA